MPELAVDEIKARIADGSVFAISLDTSIFDRYGCNLRYPSLSKLDQFKDGQVHVLLSEIVKREIEAHIARDASDTQDALKKAIRSHSEKWQLSEQDVEVPAGFNLEGDAHQLADHQFTDFATATGLEIVSGSAPDTAEVFRRYFAGEPPFGEAKKRKHEFPDAFALVSLESRAKEHGGLILCVSSDHGWREFAEASDRLICIDDVELALSLFNEAEAVTSVAEHTLALLRAGAAPTTLKAIDSALEYRLADADFDIDADAPIYFDAEPTGAIAQYIHGDSASEPIVIAADEDSVTFTTRLKAIVGFEASFSFSVRDSIDRDYVSLGSENEYVEEEVEFEVALTVARTLEGEPEVIDAEVAKQRLTVDFGYVEPFRNENPTHEKY